VPERFVKLQEEANLCYTRQHSSVVFDHLKVARNSFQHLYFDGRYNHSLTLDATIMVSKNCPTIGEQVVIIVVTQ